MKLICRYCLHFAMLMCVAAAYGQNLTIHSFEETYDIEARTHVVRDLNQDPCALVKVQLVVPNARFTSHTVFETKRRDMEYLVYMVNGSDHLEIQAPGYLPMHVVFDNYGIKRLKSLTTYNLVIEAPAQTLPYISKVLIGGTDTRVNEAYTCRPTRSDEDGVFLYFNSQIDGNLIVYLHSESEGIVQRMLPYVQDTLNTYQIERDTPYILFSEAKEKNGAIREIVDEYCFDSPGTYHLYTIFSPNDISLASEHESQRTTNLKDVEFPPELTNEEFGHWVHTLRTTVPNLFIDQKTINVTEN